MNTLPGLLGAVILFWGWQGGYWAVALPCAVLIEAARWVPQRWAFDAARLNRIGDVCAVLTVLAAVGLYLTQGNPRAVTQLFFWLPVIYLPLALAQAYGMQSAISLGVLLPTVRRYRNRTPMHLNLAYPYAGLWLVAASAANRRDGTFEVVLIGLLLWALWHARPRSRALWHWLLLLPVLVVMGSVGHRNLRELQLWLEGSAVEWLSSNAGGNTDPYRADTNLGHIGSLKQSDRIVLRLRSTTGSTRLDTPLLLHQASYDTYTGLRWLAKNAPFTTVPPTGSMTWVLQASSTASASANTTELAIVAQTTHTRPVLALPAGTQRMEGLAASDMQRNSLDAVQIEHRPGFVSYRAIFVPGVANAIAPRPDDLVIPPRELAVFTRIAQTLGLKDMPADQTVAAVQRYFADGFSYSLKQDTRQPSVPPLLDFMERTHAGHCEYFASATVLLLRAAGIPARYATGYAVQEWSARENAHLVRERHAHAWVRAWVHGAWREIDTTPATWAALEADSAPWWVTVADWWNWLRYRFAQLQTDTAQTPWQFWLVFTVVFVVWFGWRIFGKPTQTLSRTSSPATTQARPGSDSPFFRMEQALLAKAGQRLAHETVQEWVQRVAGYVTGAHAAELAALLQLHYRYRFDPQGLSAQELRAFDARVTAWLSVHAATH